MASVNGAALPATPLPEAAHRDIGDNDGQITYSPQWQYSTNRDAVWQRDGQFTNIAATAATVPFWGNSVPLVGTKGLSYSRSDGKVCEASGARYSGKLINDVCAATVSTNQALFSAAGLASGQHKLDIAAHPDSSDSSHYTGIDYLLLHDGISGTRYIDNWPDSDRTNAGLGTRGQEGQTH